MYNRDNVKNAVLDRVHDGTIKAAADDISMAAIKTEDFKDVNTAWDGLDVLIYTGTMTAGISFELLNFDVLVGVYVDRTSSPLAFTQGLHRVRNLADK
jgi:hypothetical protein